MGIDVPGLKALQVAKLPYRADFTRSVMLGRQEINFWPSELEQLPIRRHLRDGAAQLPVGSFAEPLFEALGATRIDSLDASTYEGASIVADFNVPLPQQYHGQYTCYCDFGSMEHIFNTPQVIANCSALLAEQGTVLIVTNCDGFPSHGFYQFSPEFFYSVFSAANGFERTLVFVVALWGGEWFFVPRPARQKCRSRLNGLGRSYVVCLSQKRRPLQSLRAVQSDYALDAWSQADHRHTPKNLTPPSERPITFRDRVRSIPMLDRPRAVYRALFTSGVKLGEDLHPFDPSTATVQEIDALAAGQ